MVLSSYCKLAGARQSVVRHTRSWRYEDWWNWRHEIQGMTVNLEWIWYLVFEILTRCWTISMLFLVYAVLSVYYSRCQLIIITSTDQEGWPRLTFCDDSWAVEETDRWVQIMGLIWMKWADMSNQRKNILDWAVKTTYSCSSPLDRERYLQYWEWWIHSYINFS